MMIEVYSHPQDIVHTERDTSFGVVPVKNGFFFQIEGVASSGSELCAACYGALS